MGLYYNRTRATVAANQRDGEPVVFQPRTWVLVENDQESSASIQDLRRKNILARKDSAPRSAALEKKVDFTSSRRGSSVSKAVRSLKCLNPEEPKAGVAKVPEAAVPVPATVPAPVSDSPKSEVIPQDEETPSVPAAKTSRKRR